MTQKKLSGKKALVTGAGRRIGRAIALSLAKEGADIVIHYRNSAAEAKELGGQLSAMGVRSWPVKADFARPDEYSTLITRSIEAAGQLDILVNSASIFLQGTLSDMELAGLTSHMEVNAWVPFLLSRDFARHAKRGDIINLLDTRVDGYDWAHVPYILSKHVLSALTKMTALEYAPDIRVNGVAPGLILPPPGKDESYLDKLVDTVPLKRHGSPEDVAEAVIYLLKSDFLTGTVIHVDGGRHIMEYRHGPHPD